MNQTMHTRNVRWILVLLLPVLFTLKGPGQDGGLPLSPEITFITLDSASHDVIISWEPSISDSIEKYRIYTVPEEEMGKENPSAEILAEVSSATYEYRHVMAQFNPLVYVVTSVDSSDNESLIGNDFHSPVKLIVSYDSCAQQMVLNWSGYMGWESGLAGYRVYGFNCCQPEFEALVGPSKRSYVHEGVREDTTYAYHVVALSNQGFMSRSNNREYYTEMPEPPEFINLNQVTVKENHLVDISFTADLTGEMDDFQVLKSGSPDGIFNPWTIVENVTASTVEIEDSFPAAGQQVFYRVDALNSCGHRVASSNISGNILLTGEVFGTQVRLNWTPYTGFKGGVDRYDIRRISESGEYLGEPVSLGSGTTTYAENLEEVGLSQRNGRITYRVEAVETSSNPHGIMGKSASNLLRLDVGTSLFMPNAFTPNGDGRNDRFGPVFDFFPEDFRMIIFDRSGKKLFETNSPDDGWDGTDRGRGPAPQGVYIYHVEYTSHTGLKAVKTDNVTLIRP